MLDQHELALWYVFNTGASRDRADSLADAHVHLHPDTDPEALTRDQLRQVAHVATQWEGQ